MDRNKMLQFMNANPACCLATVENDRPRVRGMLMYRADEQGILFHTASFKDLYRQVQENPLVEVCFTSPDGSLQVRVSGRAEVVDDVDLKKEVVEARDFLKPWVYPDGFDKLKLLRVRDCVATLWTFDRNFTRKEFVRLTDAA